MRWLVSKETLLADPRTDRVSIETPGAFVEWSAPDRRLVAYPCGDDKIMNMCAFAPSSEFQDPENTSVDGMDTKPEQRHHIILIFCRIQHIWKHRTNASRI
jgi:salicylate hydroxylase